ncbi:putative porin [Dendrosporobacter sp. 1207_IL3150]|uniref:putative porin n=1 Tax=Dendrosporobacter sp. 1207_IL3150 TaxID=3084054 RepID=UPI002FD8E88E
MKKKILAAAVLAAMTLSTASVFASPAFSGDSKIEFINKDSGSDLSSRFRLNVDASIDENLNVHARYNTGGYSISDGAATVDASIDQAYIGAIIKDSEIRVGRQSLWLGKGMLMDGDAFNGVQVATGIDNVAITAFTGKDANHDKTTQAEIGTSFGNVNVGANYLKLDDTKFYGINFDTKVAENTVLNVEYVKNTTDKNDGYIAELKVGEAVKKGDFDYAVSYRNIEDGAVTGYSTDSQFNDSKGFRVAANYKVSDNSTLNIKQDIAENNAGSSDKKFTDITFSVNF